MEAEDINGFSGSSETETRIGEDDDAQGDKDGGNDGFHDKLAMVCGLVWESLNDGPVKPVCAPR